MILEYRRNNRVWIATDSRKIATCYYGVKKDIDSIKEKFLEDEDKLRTEILRFLKRKVLESGFVVGDSNIHVLVGNERYEDMESVFVVVLLYDKSIEAYVFDYNYPFRICYNDGTIFQDLNGWED